MPVFFPFISLLFSKSWDLGFRTSASPLNKLEPIKFNQCGICFPVEIVKRHWLMIFSGPGDGGGPLTVPYIDFTSRRPVLSLHPHFVVFPAVYATSSNLLVSLFFANGDMLRFTHNFESSNSKCSSVLCILFYSLDAFPVWLHKCTHHKLRLSPLVFPPFRFAYGLGSRVYDRKLSNTIPNEQSLGRR